MLAGLVWVPRVQVLPSHSIASPQIGGINEGAPRGVDLSDEGIEHSSCVGPLIRVLGREVGGVRLSRHIGIP